MKIADLSAKQLIGCLGYYNSYVGKQTTFTEFLENCTFGEFRHENSEVHYWYPNPQNWTKHATIHHGFFGLYKSEEDAVVAALLSSIHPASDD